ncbi:MAG: hypothetical protein JO182_32525 [Acidobacteriaceae bacterium]|nr:hypothetical protein [Acidobacteriaceae bacterium]
MVSAITAAHFWAAVEDCLVQFHQMERSQAAMKVTELWRRLPTEPKPRCGEPLLDEMIYHAEPWYIACNLAGAEPTLDFYQAAYTDVLKKNGLA